MNDYFGLLFARPSFAEGASRVMDIGGTMVEYNSSLTGSQADYLALTADINALKEDLARVRQQIPAESKQIEYNGDQ